MFVGLVLFLLVFVKLMVLLVEDPLVLGFLVLTKSFLVTLLVSFGFTSWFSLIFFLIYVGGMLVLIFYALTLNSNPFSSWSISYFWFFVFFFLSAVFVFSFFPDLDLKGTWEPLGLNLWSLEEVKFVIGIVCLLLMVLWLMTKLIFKVRGAFRPFF